MLKGLKLLKIIDKVISEIKEYENNPRFNDKSVDKVAASIKEFGFKVPIIIDENNEIVAGHTRFKAAQQLQLTKIPCIVADDLTPKQIKAFRIADNKVSEFSTWDEEKLYNELIELQMLDFNVESFGFDIKEIKGIEDNFDTDFELPDSDKPLARTITLTLAEEQFDIVNRCVEYVIENDLIKNTFDNANRKSNAIFEVIYEWEKLKNLS